MQFPSASQILNQTASVGGSATARVLGAANSLAGGAIASVLFNNPAGRLALDAGYKYAALGGTLVKGVLAWEGTCKNSDGAPIPCYFKFPMNPEALDESLAPDYAAHKAPGQNRPVYHFVHGGERELSFTLHFFYDSTDRRLIRDQLDTLRSLTQRAYVPKAAQGGAEGPPPVYLYFGEYIQGQRFIVKSLKIKLSDLFDPANLLPLRAEVEVTLLEAQDPTLSETNDPRKNFTIQSRGSLGSIASRIGNPF